MHAATAQAVVAHYVGVNGGLMTPQTSNGAISNGRPEHRSRGFHKSSTRAGEASTGVTVKGTSGTERVGRCKRKEKSLAQRALGGELS